MPICCHLQLLSSCLYLKTVFRHY